MLEFPPAFLVTMLKQITGIKNNKKHHILKKSHHRPKFHCGLIYYSAWESNSFGFFIGSDSLIPVNSI